ncbi:hypothetical protein CW751_01695 [Brumimicrobium salinarum]|uniref:DUF58 domain-containing protein n=1 Tax=Brumimicrobium salinarum TaxID=2058658 RepID=A0A2I0R671_9FLAO|nr:hypothetical protein [Brumimicrobium salinarum]PKR82076.1 hypothetical protein CW751_01695 [Brumimicrobium salinarum]
MIKAIYISYRFFVVFGIAVIFLITGYYWMPFFYFGQFLFIVLFLFLFLDVILLFNQSTPISVKRNIPNRLNLGDETKIQITIKNTSQLSYSLMLIDEPPIEMQARSLTFQNSLKANKEKSFTYTFTPSKRGVYEWKNIHVFLATLIGLVERRIIVEANEKITVYPSIKQMNDFEFYIFNHQSQQRGIKKFVVWDIIMNLNRLKIMFKVMILELLIGKQPLGNLS